MLCPPIKAYKGEEAYIFISYAHKDSDFVFPEIERLAADGFKIWYDEGIEPSEEWPEEIGKAIVNCGVFLIFVSPRSAKSVNCRNEVNLALNNNKKFLAVHIEETELPVGLQLRMGDLQAILKYNFSSNNYQLKLEQSLTNLFESNQTDHSDNSYFQKHSSKEDKKLKPLNLKLAYALLAVFIFAGLFYIFKKDHNGNTDASDQQLSNLPEKDFKPGKHLIVPGLKFEMIWCEPGSFMMGSPESEVDRNLDWNDKPALWNEILHEVKLTNGFFLGKFEVTQKQWFQLFGSKPSFFSGNDLPVEQINWYEANNFCEKLTVLEKSKDRIPDNWIFTLPTEAEWEYACRAGSSTVFAYGEDLSSEMANFHGGFPYGNAKESIHLIKTAKVGSYSPNAWGFYDMHGNVGEWCLDWNSLYKPGTSIDPFGTVNGSHKVKRGGGYNSKGHLLRSATRSRYRPNEVTSGLGFRVVLKRKPQDSSN